MSTIWRKLMTVVAVLAVTGLVIGGAVAIAQSADPQNTDSTPSVSSVDDDGTLDQGSGDVPDEDGNDDDDGTPDQGPGDVPAEHGSGDDDGTPDQGSGDFPFDDDEQGDDDDQGEDEDEDEDNSGPSENSGPGSTDDDQDDD